MSKGLHSVAERTWYGRSALSLLLAPLSGLYGAAVARRRRRFATGRLASHRVAAPVIVVGNIAVGGTGKTPVTLWLAGRLAGRGYRPAIVSRGYGGKPGDEPLVVHAASDPAVAGDEAVLMAQGGICPVIVHPDRVAAANRAIEEGANVIIADDGLQHYRLQRDYEIAVIDGARGHGNGRLLPAGPLREPVERLRSVNCVLVQRGSDDCADVTVPGQSPIDFRLVASRFCRLDNSTQRDIGEFAGLTMHALAGIGNPERFFGMLEAAGIQVLRHPLQDHATIVAEQLDYADGLEVVMTEKDAVKCRGFDHGHCWYVPVDVEMAGIDTDNLLDDIAAAIEPAAHHAKDE